MDLEIYKIKKDNSSISFCPNRWWLITSVIINGKELLFMNEETLFDTSKSVRWWIPILFPNAWIIPDKQIDYWFDLKQHWFARNIPWEYKILSENKFIMSLESYSWTKWMYDYDFKLEITWEIHDNDKIKITQNIINIGNKDLPISCWLHPYFQVPQDRKSEMKFIMKDWNIIEWDINNRWNWVKTVVANPWKFSVYIPWTWEIHFDYTNSFEQIWIRSESWKNFICIEPIMRNEPSILDNPYMVWVWENITLEIKFDL